MGTARTRRLLVGLGVVVQESGGRHDHKVVQVRAGSVRPLEPPGAYKQVPRRVLGRGGQIRGTS
jgi:hypothetical protein